MRYTGDSREICAQLIEIDEEEQPLPKGKMWAKIALTERLINKVIEHKLQLRELRSIMNDHFRESKPGGTKEPAVPGQTGG